MLNAIFLIKLDVSGVTSLVILPHGGQVYSYFRSLCAKNIFEKISSHLNIQIRLKDGRDLKPSLFCIDSQSVEGDVNLDQKGTDGNKKVKGRKRHIVTDVLGVVFFCIIAAANISVIHPGREFITQMLSNERLEKILIDGAYQGISGKHENFTVEVSSKKPDQEGFVPLHKKPDQEGFVPLHKKPDQEGFVPLHKRWIIERTFKTKKVSKRLRI